MSDYRQRELRDCQELQRGIQANITRKQAEVKTAAPVEKNRLQQEITSQQAELRRQQTRELNLRNALR